MKDVVRRKSARIPRHTGEDSKSSGRSRSETRVKSAPGRKRRSSLSDDRSTKKRNLSPVNVPTFQNVGKTHINGRLVDSYCWLCHKVTNETFCERCPRRYHEACLVKAKLDSKYCECQNISVDGRTPMPWCPTELKQCLEYAVQEAIKEEKKNSQKSDRVENVKIQKYFKNWPTVSANECLNTIVDITVLIDKMNNDPPYLNTGSFFSDVKWIYHNSYIVYGANHDVTKTALTLEKNFKQELVDIEACRECYINKHKQESIHSNYFIRLCSKPHPIVWAKMRRYPFWPAKCLKIHNGHADVRFFGTHEKANILLNQVFKYSKEHPENKGHSQQKFKESMSETEYYISNYENKCGTFQYFKKKTPLDVGIAKKPHRKGRGRGCYESPKKHRSEDSTLEAADNNEDSPTIEKNSTVDVKDVPRQDGHFDSASTKKKSSEPLTTPANKDPVDMKVKVVMHPIPVPIMSFCEGENEDASNLRPDENFLVVNSNLDHLMPSENEKNASDGHATDDHLEDPPPASLSFDNPPIMDDLSDVNPYIKSKNSNEPVKRNTGNCSSQSSSNDCSPVITSAVGDADSHGQTKEFRSPTCDTLANFLSFSRHSLFKEKSVPGTRNICENKDDQQEGKDSDEEEEDDDDDDDDECQILPESETMLPNSQMSAIAKNSALRNSLIELFLANKPRGRQLYKQFQNLTSVLFIAMSLEANESNSFENIQEIYAKYLTKITSLEADKQKLIAENLQLKENCEKLNQKVVELDAQKNQKQLLRDMIVNATANKHIDILKQRFESSIAEARHLSEKLNETVAEKQLLTQAYQMELANKNKEIEELKGNIPVVLKCDQECQADYFFVVNDASKPEDFHIRCSFKELCKIGPDSFEEQEFSHTENSNEMCSITEQQQNITETIEHQTYHSFSHPSLQFQNHSETTSTSSQMFMEQIAVSSSNVLSSNVMSSNVLSSNVMSSNVMCERNNLIMSDSTTYVSSTVISPSIPPLIVSFPAQLSAAPPVQLSTAPPVQLSTAPPVQLSTAPPVQLSTAPPVQLSTAPPVQLSTAPPAQVNTYSDSEDAQTTQSCASKRKPRQNRKPVPSTPLKKGNKKNG